MDLSIGYEEELIIYCNGFNRLLQREEFRVSSSRAEKIFLFQQNHLFLKDEVFSS